MIYLFQSESSSLAALVLALTSNHGSQARCRSSCSAVDLRRQFHVHFLHSLTSSPPFPCSSGAEDVRIKDKLG